MGTLSDYSSPDSIARSKRGQTTRSLGATTIAPTTPARPKQNALQQSGQKIGSIVSQTGHILGAGALAAGKFVANTPKYVYEGMHPFLQGVASTVTGEKQAELRNINTQSDQLDKQMTNVVDLYKSGKISKDSYSKILRDISGSQQELSKSAQTVATEANRGNIATSAANTAATILLGGRLSLSKSPQAALRRTVTTGALTEGKQKVLQSLIAQNSTKLESAIQKIPAVKDLVFRNTAYFGRREAQQLAGETTAQYLAREGKALAVNFILKRPIVYETNISGAQDLYNHMIEGKYGGAATEAAWLGTQMLSGGPIGAVAKGFRWLNNKTSKLAYGTGSFIDELSKQIGNKNGAQVAEYLANLKNNNPKEFAKAERVLRIAQETNLQMAGENATEAANRALQHWADSGIQLENVTPSKVVDLFENWAVAHELKTSLIKAGKIPSIASKNADKYVPVRWDVDAKNAFADIMKSQPEDIQAIKDAYNAWRLAPANAAGQNFLLTNKIESIINNAFKTAPEGKVGEQIAKDIKGISAVSVMPKGIPEDIKKRFEKLGFSIAQPFNGAEKITPAVEFSDTRKLITAAETGATDIFDPATAPEPNLNFFSSTLQRLGLSPQGSTQASTRTLSQQVVSELAGLNEAKNLGFTSNVNADSAAGGRVILSKLQQYLENIKPSRIGEAFVGGTVPTAAATDIRQLTIGEIEDALKVTRTQAKAVRKAVINAYTKVPMEYRGLGDKIVDNLYKFNPVQPYYSRVQSALRYTYNPFFRVQESVETRLLSHAQTKDLLWQKPADYAGSTRQWLTEASKKLDQAGIFTTGLSGEASQDLVLGRITANITNGQKRQLAGLATAMAKQRGITLDQMLEQHGDEVGDALRVVVQYPNKGVLNSSLARTLNLAFFPMRYNIKVTALAASILAKEPPAIQLATINSLYNLRDWLKSDEGIAWQSANADAMQVFNWITPIGSIEYTLNLLTHKPNSLGDMGALGGLPIGVLTQILDSQGIININKPYVNPKTGDVLPKYIPQTTKARAATAIGDVLNSMFTYPGRILGLPGKQQSINNIVKSFIATNGKDFEKRINTDNLTPLQQNWIRVLKGDTSQEAIDALYRSPATGQFDWYTIPPLSLPMKEKQSQLAPFEQRTGLPTKASKKKGKRVKPIAQPISSR